MPWLAHRPLERSLPVTIQTANASLALCVGRSSQFPRDPRPEIALSGRSNVGKSSLINTLLGRKSLARVSSTPGKTITINYYSVDRFYLVDLPGYGYARRSQDSKAGWSSLTEDFFLKNPSADALRLVIQLIDIRTGPSTDDIHMINFMLERGIPFTVVATKTDKLSKARLAEALKELEDTVFAGTGITPLPFSSVTKEGKEQLLRVISDALER
ncbi:MAG: YihA family ribosome biogenesis GTP-binding protein [Clostridia bacterium]|nr:YihA family ribosome biogenesis GTP-binding protein [Clostridia bacterium]